ncbi:amidohydrolase family protein [Sinomonas atrocyanea]
MPYDLLITNARYLDASAGEYREGDIRVVDGTIAEIGADLAAAGQATVDASGKFVLPGLIDCHVHVTAATADLTQLGEWSPNYAALNTARLMGNMLDRGFTTVRDVAGADFGLHDAQAEGLLRGPRLFFGGKALSQTGGHADPRPRGRAAHDGGYCCPHIGRLADGVDQVRQAARDELRKGAHHIKIMAGGGVASPTDRIDSTQYSVSEIEAAVEEAEAANRYVTAHAYTGRAINRALRAGVRGIEHGNLLDDESLELFKEHNAFLTMNLVTYWALEREGRNFGLSQENWEKVAEVLDGGYEALGRAHEAGINLAYGSDLLGGMQAHQAKEFAIRGKIQPAIDVIRSATTTAAALLQREGQLGVIAPGAHGDFVITGEDPVADLSVLADTRLDYVIQGGSIVRGPGNGPSEEGPGPR